MLSFPLYGLLNSVKFDSHMLPVLCIVSFVYMMATPAINKYYIFHYELGVLYGLKHAAGRPYTQLWLVGTFLWLSLLRFCDKEID